MRRIGAIILILLLNACAFTHKNVEENIVVSKTAEPQKIEITNWENKYVTDIFVEKIEGHENMTTNSVEVDGVNFEFNIKNQYYIKNEYGGLWPIVPLFPYLKYGSMTNSEKCVNNMIVLELDVSKKELGDNVIISNVYIVGEGRTVFPNNKDALPRVVQNLMKSSTYKMYYTFPLYCKDINNSELHVEAMVNGKKHIFKMYLFYGEKTTTNRKVMVLTPIVKTVQIIIYIFSAGNIDLTK